MTTTPFNESLGSGLRRDHRATCPSTADRKTGRKCDCPISFWVFDPSRESRRRRERVSGDLTVTQARREKERLNADARDRAARSMPTSTPTMFEWTEKCFGRIWLGQQRSPKTLKDREVAYRLRIHPYLGSMPVDEITPTVIDDWLHERITADGHRRCVEYALETLSAILGQAAKHRVIDYNPAQVVSFPRKPVDLDDDVAVSLNVMTLQQYRHLVASCRTTSDVALVRVATEAGLRVGELTALRWRDVDLREDEQGGFVHVKRAIWQSRETGKVAKLPKGRKPRIVGISEDLVTLLRHYLDEAAPPDQDHPLWPGRGTRAGKRDLTQPMSPSSLGHRIRRLIKHAGFTDDDDRPLFSAHDLRRTGASLAQAADVPLHIIQRQLGNKYARTTEEHYLMLPERGALQVYADAFTTP